MTKEVLVEQIMSRNVVTGKESESVYVISKRMKDHGIGALVITNEAGGITGIFTDRDANSKIVSKALDSRKILVKECMTKPVTTGTPDMSDMQLAMLFSKKSIKKLPIVNNEKLVGMVTESDFLKLLSIKWGLAIDSISLKLLKLMRKEFGNLGPLYLQRELVNRKPKDMHTMTDGEKEKLIDSLMVHVFGKTMSQTKQRRIRSQLHSILNFSKEKKQAFNEMAAVDFLLGRPR